MSFSKVAYSGSMFLFLRCNCDPLSALLIYLILLGLLWLILPPQKMQWKKERHWVNVPRPQPSKRAMISGMGIRSPHGWRCAVKTKSLKKKLAPGSLATFVRFPKNYIIWSRLFPSCMLISSGATSWCLSDPCTGPSPGHCLTPWTKWPTSTLVTLVMQVEALDLERCGI